MQTILINAETSAAPERAHKVKRSDLEIQNGAGRQNRVSMNMCSCLHETHFFLLLLQIGKPVYYDTTHLCLISKLLLLYSVITPRKCV